jgi:hypothetical protein
MVVDMKWISVSVLMLSLGTAPALADQDVVYRWTDENGEVQYSKTLPPEASKLPHDILSPRGIVLRQILEPGVDDKDLDLEDADDEEDKEPEGLQPLYTEEEKQRLSDRLLMLRYRSEQEILDAMQLEVDQLKYDERILSASRDSAAQALAGEVHTAANMRRAGLDVDEARFEKISGLQRRLSGNRDSMQKLKFREEQIRNSFTRDLERYRGLTAEPEADG